MAQSGPAAGIRALCVCGLLIFQQQVHSSVHGWLSQNPVAGMHSVCVWLLSHLAPKEVMNVRRVSASYTPITLSDAADSLWCVRNVFSSHKSLCEDPPVYAFSIQKVQH